MNNERLVPAAVIILIVLLFFYWFKNSVPEKLRYVLERYWPPTVLLIALMMHASTGPKWWFLSGFLLVIALDQLIAVKKGRFDCMPYSLLVGFVLTPVPFMHIANFIPAIYLPFVGIGGFLGRIGPITLLERIKIAVFSIAAIFVISGVIYFYCKRLNQKYSQLLSGRSSI